MQHVSDTLILSQDYKVYHLKLPDEKRTNLQQKSSLLITAKRHHLCRQQQNETEKLLGRFKPRDDEGRPPFLQSIFFLQTSTRGPNSICWQRRLTAAPRWRADEAAHRFETEQEA